MRAALLFVFAAAILVVSAQNCGCGGDEPCCSQYGYCGATADYCDTKNGCKEGCWGSASSGSSTGGSTGGGNDGGNGGKSGKLFHHNIMFRYRDGVTQEQIDSVTKAYLDVGNKALRNGKKYITIVGGATLDTEGVADNFRNGFILTFSNADDRDHFMCCEKAHQDFGNFMGQYVTPSDYNVGFDFQEEGTAPWLNSTNGKLYHHVITFRYKPEVTQKEIDSVTQAYVALNDKAIRNGKKYINIVGGRTISTEGVASNFRNGFVLTFKSQDDMDHFGCCEKAHQDFGDFMGQYVTDHYNVGFNFQEQF